MSGNGAPAPAFSGASGRRADRTPGPDHRRRREAVRKLIHLGMVVLPAWVWWSPLSWRARGLLLAFLLVLGADLLRRAWKPWASWIDRHFRAYSRPRESDLWVGVHAMFLAAWILSWSVSREVAVAGLCYGVFGDAAAALVGMRHGEARFERKSLVGSAACFVTCVGVGWLLLADAQQLWVGAAAATVLERFSGPIDDNLTIPLGSALALSLLA